MTYEKKFELNCDYEFAMLLSEDGETLVGGSRRALKNAVKNRNFANKKIDVFFAVSRSERSLCVRVQ